jgi:hypothetical protein
MNIKVCFVDRGGIQTVVVMGERSPTLEPSVFRIKKSLRRAFAELDMREIRPEEVSQRLEEKPWKWIIMAAAPSPTAKTAQSFVRAMIDEYVKRAVNPPCQVL